MGQSVRQKITLQQGIPTEKAKEIVRIVKDSKKKVQASIQGDSVRISGKDRDGSSGHHCSTAGQRPRRGTDLHELSHELILRDSETIEHPGNSNGERSFRTAARRPRCDRAGVGARRSLKRQYDYRDCRILAGRRRKAHSPLAASPRRPSARLLRPQRNPTRRRRRNGAHRDARSRRHHRRRVNTSRPPLSQHDLGQRKMRSRGRLALHAGLQGCA